MKERLKIDGMSCGGCVAGVEHALKSVGVERSEVTVGEAIVEYDGDSISLRQIVEAIEESGFSVKEA